jgi:methyltransferase-like protein
MMLLRNLPDKVQQVFHQLPAVQQEQYMDFVRNRRFRKTLLCHRDLRLKRRVSPAQMKRFHLALAPGVQAQGVDIRDEKLCHFRLGNRTLNAGNRLTKAALMYLKEIRPRYVSFAELYVTALARVGQPRSAETDDPTLSADTLAHNLLVGYSIDLLEIAVHPPRCVVRLNARPLASPLARLQAARGCQVTNQLHRTVGVDAVGQRLLSRLDGAHERADLIASVEEAVQAGEVKIQNGGRPVKKVDPAALSSILDQALSRFSESALLIG